MSGKLIADMAPDCTLCGEGIKLFPESAVLGLPGQWLVSAEHDMPIFVPDPDIQMTIISLPNGQLGFILNGKEPELHMHDECFEQMSDEFLYAPEDIDEGFYYNFSKED